MLVSMSEKTAKDRSVSEQASEPGAGVPGPSEPGAGVQAAGVQAGESRRSVKRLTDPRALRALAHPTRLSLVGLLRREGPLTATKASEALGESSASCSFHLRQLAKYGLVEEAGGGTGRERPWQATTMFTAWPDVAEGTDQAAATDLLASVIADRYFNDLFRWLEARSSDPEDWQRAAQFGDTMLWLTVDELADLGVRTQEMVDIYLDRQDHPELRPPGARMVTYLHIAHPAVPLPGEKADR
jgi:DNA-binding transcriptional ArsR family regulator